MRPGGRVARAVSPSVWDHRCTGQTARRYPRLGDRMVGRARQSQSSRRTLACHAVSGSSPTAGQGVGAQPNGRLRVTVSVRWIPLVTAAYGTRVARLARTTMLAPGGDGSPVGKRVRSVLGDHRLVGKSPEGSRQPRLWAGAAHIVDSPLRRWGVAD
jgi:hypothetical protein